MIYIWYIRKDVYEIRKYNDIIPGYVEVIFKGTANECIDFCINHKIDAEFVD